MNAKRKESAVKKYAGKFENEQELIDAVKADEKAYTEEEVQEIVEAIQAGSDAGDKGPEKKGTTSKIPHDLWLCRIERAKDKEPEAKKLEKQKTGVLITEEQAAVLNEGVLYGSNAQGPVYFPAE